MEARHHHGEFVWFFYFLGYTGRLHTSILINTPLDFVLFWAGSDSNDWDQELTDQHAYTEQNPEPSPLQVLNGTCPHSDLHRQTHVRRKFSSQSLGGSRIVPTRLIGSQHDQTPVC